MKKEENKIALVAGVGRVITLAKQGFKVVLTGRSKEKLDKMAKEIDDTNVIVIPTDVSEEKSIQELKEKLIQETEVNLDLLVNNVGGVPATGNRRNEFGGLEENSGSESDDLIFSDPNFFTGTQKKRKRKNYFCNKWDGKLLYGRFWCLLCK